MYDCMNESNPKRKKQCFSAHKSKQDSCYDEKSESKSQVKIYDYSFETCKGGTGMHLYDCMREENLEAKQQCTDANTAKVQMCEEEGGRRICLRKAEMYRGCAERGIDSCIRKLEWKTEDCMKKPESGLIMLSAPFCAPAKKGRSNKH